MTDQELRELAKFGARAQLQQIFGEFPDLLVEVRGGGNVRVVDTKGAGKVPIYGPAAVPKITAEGGVMKVTDNGHEPILRHSRIAKAAAAEPPKPARRFVSAKQRAQISRRMKAYWRQKRAEAAR